MSKAAKKRFLVASVVGAGGVVFWLLFWFTASDRASPTAHGASRAIVPPSTTPQLEREEGIRERASPMEANATLRVPNDAQGPIQSLLLLARCEDLSGRPVARAKLVASLRSLPSQNPIGKEPGREGIRGMNPNTAIYTAESDHEGRVAIDVMAPGRYQVRATAEGRDVVSRNATVANVPGSECEIQFADIVCGRIRVLGDAVLSYNGKGTGGFVPEFLGKAEVQRVREEAQSAFPEDLVFVGLDGDKGDQEVAFEVDVLLAEHGLRHLRAPLTPFRDGCSETLLDLVGDQGARSPCVSTRFEIVSSSGIRLPASDLYLQRDFDGKTFQFEIKLDKEQCLPAGEYEVMSFDPYLSTSCVTRAVVVSPEKSRYEIEIDGEVMPYRVRLEDEYSTEISNPFIQIDAQGVHHMFQAMKLDALDVWLPSGAVKINASAFGYQPSEWMGNVGSAPIEPGGVITIVLVKR